MDLVSSLFSWCNGSSVLPLGGLGLLMATPSLQLIVLPASLWSSWSMASVARRRGRLQWEALRGLELRTSVTG